MAAKLRVMWDHYSASDRQYPVDLRVPDFGALISRLNSELDFIDIEYRTGELNMGCSRGLLACKVTDRNERLVRALDRELARRAAEIPTTGRWSDRIKYYMRTNHLSDVSLEEICDNFRVQRRALARLLRSEGTNFTAILSELRHERAVHLVRHTEIPLKRVAAELGFNSDASFNMAFKSWTGETPMRFRKAAPAKAAANDQESARAGFAGRPRSHGVPQHLSYAAVRPVAIARPLLATYRPCS
jgi:AraC-like DNA-binding protein